MDLVLVALGKADVDIDFDAAVCVTVAVADDVAEAVATTAADEEIVYEALTEPLAELGATWDADAVEETVVEAVAAVGVLPLWLADVDGVGDDVMDRVDAAVAVVETVIDGVVCAKAMPKQHSATVANSRNDVMPL